MAEAARHSIGSASDVENWGDEIGGPPRRIKRWSRHAGHVNEAAVQRTIDAVP